MPNRTLNFARIARAPGKQSLFQRDFALDLLTALAPERTVTRYGRTWRLSRPVRADGFIQGKLGFTRPGQEQATIYDGKVRWRAGWILCDDIPHAAPRRAMHVQGRHLVYQVSRGCHASRSGETRCQRTIRSSPLDWL